jgi:hypothetical protein
MKGMTSAGSQRVRQLLSWGLPSIIAASYLVLRLQPDLRSAFPALIGATCVIVISIGIILYAGTKGLVGWSPGVIILVSLIFRAFFLFSPPQLSDDIYRYLWDGLQVLHGQNPYSEVPLNAPPPDEASLELLHLMNHPDLGTIYPPVAQIFFAAGAYLGPGSRAFKAILTLLDSISCILIIKMLLRAGLPAWQATIYAWHPLPVIEIASSGHIDGAGIFFVFLTLLLLQTLTRIPSIKRGQPSRTEPEPEKYLLIAVSAGFAFAFAVLVKFFPLIFLPGIFMLAGKRFSAPLSAGILGGLICLAVPFLPQLKNLLVVLNVYILNWEFAGFAFRTLRRLTSSGNLARLILASLFLFISTALYRRLLTTLRRLPDNSCGYSRGPGCAPINRCFLECMKTFYSICMAYLLLTPTLHPWYALYLVCFLPFAPGAAGLALTWAVFLSYRVLAFKAFSGQWVENDWIPLLIWVAPVLAFLIAGPFRRLNEHSRSAV